MPRLTDEQRKTVEELRDSLIGNTETYDEAEALVAALARLDELEARFPENNPPQPVDNPPESPL